MKLSYNKKIEKAFDLKLSNKIRFFKRVCQWCEADKNSL